MKKIGLCLVLVLAATLLIKKKSPEQQKHISKIQEKKQVGRSIASIPHKKIEIKKPMLKQTVQIHKKAQEKLQEMFKDDFEVNIIKKLRSTRTLRKNHSHVLVKLKNKHKKGVSSSYDAIVDDSTGRIIKTWNRTNFEGVMDLEIKGKGKEFYSY